MYPHIRQYSPNFMNYAVLTISTQDTFVVFRTFDAFHGRSRQIFLRISPLFSWINGEEDGTYMEHDIHSSVRFIRSKGRFDVELTSLREDDGDLKGFIHRFSLDPDRLACILTTRYEEHKQLITIRQQNAQARILIPLSTQAYIRDTILPDKKLKRAFIRAISRNFMYGKDREVTLYPDYDGFFFRETNGIFGGLILTETTCSGHKAVKYTIHT